MEQGVPYVGELRYLHFKRTAKSVECQEKDRGNIAFWLHWNNLRIKPSSKGASVFPLVAFAQNAQVSLNAKFPNASYNVLAIYFFLIYNAHKNRGIAMKKNNKIVLWGVTVLDGKKDMEPQKNRAVYICDGKIEKITEADHPDQGYVVMDLTGQYLLPGLINLHVHLPASGKPRKKASDPKKLVKLITANRLTRKLGLKICEKYARTELMSGVTTVRTVGGVSNFDTILRDRIVSGRVCGPRILASDMAISVPGGHMAGSLAWEATSAQEAASLVDRIAAGKPDLIKLMITGGVLDAEVVGEPGVLRMPAEYVKSASERAHALGLKVAAHVESPEGVKVALENGVDSIEHGAKPDDEIIRLFKEKGAFQVSTISPALPYALFDRSVSHATEEQQINGKVVFDGIIALAKACLAAGIPVGLGTDTGCPYITHYDMWRELCYFVKYCGVTPAFALYSATLRNAELSGIDDVTGSVENGKEADLIICRSNPLDDLSVLRELTYVIRAGKVIRPRLKKMKCAEAELDKFL